MQSSLVGAFMSLGNGLCLNGRNKSAPLSRSIEIASLDGTGLPAYCASGSTSAEVDRIAVRLVLRLKIAR
jgi:hypothetical protein